MKHHINIKYQFVEIIPSALNSSPLYLFYCAKCSNIYLNKIPSPINKLRLS